MRFKNSRVQTRFTDAFRCVPTNTRVQARFIDAFRRIPTSNRVQTHPKYERSFPFLSFKKMSLEAFQQSNACRHIQADTDV